MPLALGAIGFTTTIAQLILMRELVAIFYGNELFFGLVLMSWLAWTALGSWGQGRFAYHHRSRPIYLAGFVLAGFILLAQLSVIRAARLILGTTPGALIEFGQMLLITLLILAPLCLLGGALFSLGTYLISEEGKPAAQGYLYESIGGVLGGALFSFLLMKWLNPYQSAFLVLAINLLVAIHLGIPRRILVLIFSALLFILALPLGNLLHIATLGWQWQDLIFAADSPYGRLTIQAHNSQRIFYENGLLVFETQSTFPEEVVHFPMLSHPNPRRILLIGGGIAGDLGEILKYPDSLITYVELDPILIEAARNYLPPKDAKMISDPRVSLILEDGRTYVRELSQSLGISKDKLYDVIILDMPDPSTGVLNRFYTEEFFSETHSILNEDGILALGLSSSENYFSPELARRNSSIYHTLLQVFPQILILPGEHNYFMASPHAIEANPALLSQRLRERQIHNKLVTPEYINYVFTNDRYQAVHKELDATQGVRINTDLVPICYIYDLTFWLSRLSPNLVGIFERSSLINLWWVIFPLGAIVLVARWRRNWVALFAIGNLGFIQMMLEIVILFAYQVQYGSLYTEVSLIITLFMAGLALGATLSTQVQLIKRNARKTLLGLPIVLVIYSLLLPLFFISSIQLPKFIFPMFAILAGSLSGMAFPLALVRMPGKSERGAGYLYAADLIGGCLGALFGASVFIPLLGIPQTCVVIASAALCALFILI